MSLAVPVHVVAARGARGADRAQRRRSRALGSAGTAVLRIGEVGLADVARARGAVAEASGARGARHVADAGLAGDPRGARLDVGQRGAVVTAAAAILGIARRAANRVGTAIRAWAAIDHDVRELASLPATRPGQLARPPPGTRRAEPMRETPCEPSCLSPRRGQEQSRVNVKRMIHDIVAQLPQRKCRPVAPLPRASCRRASFADTREWPVLVSRALQMGRCGFSVGLAAALALVAAGQARAQSAADKQRAQELQKEGMRLLEKGDSRGALKDFDEAHPSLPEPQDPLQHGPRPQGAGARGRRGQRFRTVPGRGALCPEAEPRDGGEDRQRDPAAPVVPRHRTDDAGSRISIDGHEVGVAPLPRPLAVSPGAHQVRLEKPDMQPRRAPSRRYRARNYASSYSCVPLWRAPRWWRRQRTRASRASRTRRNSRRRPGMISCHPRACTTPTTSRHRPAALARDGARSSGSPGARRSRAPAWASTARSTTAASSTTSIGAAASRTAW